MVIALIDDDPHERNYLSSLILSEKNWEFLLSNLASLKTETIS